MPSSEFLSLTVLTPASFIVGFAVLYWRVGAVERRVERIENKLFFGKDHSDKE